MIDKNTAARLVAEGKVKHDAKTNTVTVDLGVLGKQMIGVSATDIADAEIAIIAESDQLERDIAERKANIEFETAEIERLSKELVDKKAKSDAIKNKPKSKVK
ncbi:MAG: hypothetical protein E6Q83_03510 [Thiothrix sp.]|nr:MAG: hypothetical protein E6Q83_03510 [Thiothrix sp.]